MKLTLVGATSRTGRHVVDQAALRGHEVTAFARNPAGLVDDPRIARTVAGDGRDLVPVQRAITGADAVIVIVSGGTRQDPHRCEAVSRTVAKAMSDTGVLRMLATSAYPLVAETPRLAISLLRRIFATSYADAAAMEKIVSTSELDWTIARLNRLTDAPGTGRALVAPGLLHRARPLSRADAATALLNLIEDPAAVRTAVNIGGGDVPACP